MEHHDKQHFLTEKQLAERQQRSVKTLRNQRVAGVGVPYVKLGHHVRYRLQNIEKSEQSHLRSSTSEAR